MNNIPDDLNPILLSYLDIFSIKYFRLTCKDFTMRCPKKVYHIIYKKNWVKKNFYYKIVEIFGGIDRFIEYPKMKWDKRFLSYGYISEIYINDVTDPIMIGIDSLGRAYIVLRIRKGDLRYINIIYQMSGNEKYTWYHNKYILFNGGGYFIEKGVITEYGYIDDLKKLLNGSYELRSQYGDRIIRVELV